MSDEGWVTVGFGNDDRTTAIAAQSHKATEQTAWCLVDAVTAEETNSADMTNSDLTQEAGLAIGANLTLDQNADKIDELVAGLRQNSTEHNSPLPPLGDGLGFFTQPPTKGNSKKQRWLL